MMHGCMALRGHSASERNNGACLLDEGIIMNECDDIVAVLFLMDVSWAHLQ